MKHLFLIVPPLSGSSVLHHYLSKCSSVNSFYQMGRMYEGDYVLRDAWFPIKDSPLPYVCGYYKDLIKTATDGYDWGVIKSIWDAKWAKNSKLGATVNLQKTPQDIFRVATLSTTFENVQWILSVRNPYAVVESTIEKFLQLGKSPIEHIDKILIHVIESLKVQKENKESLGPLAYTMTFEDFVARPDYHAEQIKLFMPELNDLSFRGEVEVKNKITDGVYNNNEERIAKLRNIPGAMAVVNKHFEQHEDIIKYWGYELLA